MVKDLEQNLIVGLDIGTSKVVCIVGEVKDDGLLEVIGLGSHPSKGLKKGVVVNIEATVQSMRRAIEEAELMAGCEIHSVFAGIAGSHVAPADRPGSPRRVLHRSRDRRPRDGPRGRGWRQCHGS